MTIKTKSEKRFKESSVLIGIDVHRKDSVLRGLVGDMVHKGGRVKTDADQIVDWAESIYGQADLVFGYEAGFCGLGLSRALHQRGYRCEVLHPADIPSTDKDRVFKNDRRDAKKIAQALKHPQTTFIHQIGVDHERLRQLVRSALRLDGSLRRTQQRIAQGLNYYGLGDRCRTAKGHRSWSKKSLVELEQLAHEGSYWDIGLYVESLGAQLALKKRAWALVKEQLEASFLAADYARLQTAPGIGPLLAAVISSEVGSWDRFERIDQWRSYCGLVPGEDSSGQRQKQTGLVKRANRILRWALIQAAWRAIDKDYELAKRFNAYAKTKDNRYKAIVKIASILAVRLRAMCLAGVDYQRPKTISDNGPTKG